MNASRHCRWLINIGSGNGLGLSGDYMNQCWPSSVIPYDITRPQWVNENVERLWMICVLHYGDAIMGVIASQITSLTIVYSTVFSDADQRIHQSSTSLAFVWGIHHGQVNSPHKWPVTQKMFPFDDIIMLKQCPSVECRQIFIYEYILCCLSVFW